MRIAINGFGRIGRNIARHLLSNDNFKDIELVAVNDLGSIDANAHLLKYDSVHGILDKDIAVNTEKALISIDTQDVLYLSERDPSNLPWSELEIDFVFESTGFFTKVDDAKKHIDAGAKKVIISAPSPDVEKTIVFGVNHNILDSDDVIISNASCTTNCLAPIVKVIHENFGIKSGLINTVHASTNDQSLLDVAHSDLYRARAASASMIPSKTGAAKAIGLVIPELDGKLNGLATRVPTLNVSMLD
jgi:glyceraldehyde 3-phosphate dehydrogenase